MKLEEVLPALKGGKCIRRKSMPEGYFRGAWAKEIHAGVTREDGRREFTSRYPVNFNSEEVFAEDWEVVE